MAPILALPSELTICTVGELQPAWAAWLAAGGGEAAQVDAAAVTEIDAAGVQLLLALQQSLALARRTLVVAPRSACLVAALNDLGVAGLAGASA